ncbi:thiamine phosphate synthase [Dictyobacter kobayashii]|uniref:Thiamine-phosphate synthase n=1 Tax=Dictyobacter kobayashii TaxID=2014872 RepID=A0A402AF45_9CHLR|nr:thiamine phosphate synthase [Dictyobacter kobayashii]GCE17693.1 thiamine-phosphate synthase [Dictyobacter kobayashii]
MLMRAPLVQPQLCLVTDPDMPDLLARIQYALDAGINMLQLRGPQLSASQLYELARVVAPLCECYEVPLIVNDRLDVGLAVHASGFQLGQKSLPLPVARQLVGPQAYLGASIHSVEEADSAWQQGADFLLAGTIFASASHPDGAVSGLELLRHIKASQSTCRLYAIGGITAAHAEQVMQAGADGIAVISAILRAKDVAASVKELRQAIGLS